MAPRVILAKIFPFASSKTSSLGFIEGAQRISRFSVDPKSYFTRELHKGVDLDFKEDATFEEMLSKVGALSTEDIRKVDWDKYSLNKRPSELTRDEGTKEIERAMEKMMDKEYEMRKIYEYE